MIDSSADTSPRAVTEAPSSSSEDPTEIPTEVPTETLTQTAASQTHPNTVAQSESAHVYNVSSDTPQLVALSHTLQRAELSTHNQQISLMLSATISERILPRAQRGDAPTHLNSQDRWCVVMNGRAARHLTRELKGAIELASIDERTRSFVTGRSESLVESLSPEREVSQPLGEVRELSASEYAELGFLDTVQTQLTSISLQWMHNEKLKDHHVRGEYPSQSETLPDSHAILDETLTQTQHTQELDSSAQSAGTAEYDSASCGHLLLFVSGALEEIKPRLNTDTLKSFTSVTIVAQCSSNSVLSWHRWSNAVGGRLLCLTTDTPQARESLMLELADRLQCASRGMRRVSLQLSAESRFMLVGITQLTTQAGPLPLESSARGSATQAHIWVELPAGGSRWSALLNLKRHNKQTDQARITEQRTDTIVHVRVGRLHIPISAHITDTSEGDLLHQKRRVQDLHFVNPLARNLHSEYDQLQLGVAFAQQLSHHIRVIDSLILSILRRETRKPAKLLDQLIKITVALGITKQTRTFQALKLEFLARGHLSSSSQNMLVTALLKPAFRLSHSGRWAALS